MINKQNRNEVRTRKHIRVRKKIKGSAERPRLCVFRSLSHIYAQVINDKLGNTLVSASTLDDVLKGTVKGANKESAKAVGKLVAKRAKEAGITQVVFDRGGFLYHGKIKDLADAAREEGLEF